MKFLVKALLPLTLLSTWVILSAKNIPALTDFWQGFYYVPFFVLTILTGISIGIYLVDRIKPGFFDFDFKWWRPKSYGQLSNFDKQKKWKVPGGKAMRALYHIFPIVFFFVSFIILGAVTGRLVTKELNRFGITTKAIIAQYVHTESKGTRRHITVRFRISTGSIQENRISVDREYRVGDSILIEYSSERPRVCRIAGKEYK
jgi:hypothetical protein